MDFIKKYWFYISSVLLVIGVFGFSYLVAVSIESCTERHGGVRKIVVDSGKAVKSIITEIAEDNGEK